MIQRAVKLVDRVGAEGVPDLRPVEGDADRSRADGTVVGDIGEGEPLDGVPPLRFEDLRDHDPILANRCRTPASALSGAVAPRRSPWLLIGEQTAGGQPDRVGVNPLRVLLEHLEEVLLARGPGGEQPRRVIEVPARLADVVR